MDKQTKLTTKSIMSSSAAYTNPWGVDSFDKLELRGLTTKDEYDKYRNLVSACRFFYRHDPIAATTINKLIDIGITPVIVDQGTLSVSEYAAIESVKKKLQEFLEVLALEYLVSGLVVPEIKYKTFNKQDLTKYGVKRYQSLVLPESLFIRDSATIKINTSMLSDDPSYFVRVPESIIYFIQTKGTYLDGTKDPVAYAKLATYYPEIIKNVEKGIFDILLENSQILRAKYLGDSPYPIPYLSAALESLKHKRNIRRMDYSIASRVISAVQHITLGSDEFPVVEGEDAQFEDIREQMRHRYVSNDYQEEERIFQLFTNHTVAIKWIFPDVDALLDDAKYKEVNQDIIFALGFPRILITGESERSGSSDPQYAMMSPQKTMESIRDKLLFIVVDVIYDIIKKNNFRGLPDDIRFEDINLREFDKYSTALSELYKSGNLSRDSYASFFGFNIHEEFKKRADENDELEELGLTEFGPVPFSPEPNTPGEKDTKEEDDNEKEVKDA